MSSWLSISIACLLLFSAEAINTVENHSFGFYPRNKFDPASPDLVNSLEIPTAWASSQLCSAVFVSGIDEQRAIDEEVDDTADEVDMFVDYNEKSVLAVMKGTGEWPVKAIYREGVGCTYVQGLTEAELRAQDIGDTTPLPPLNASLPWPLGDFVDLSRPPAGVDMAKLNQLIDAEFADEVQRVRAILVVYKGAIILERYDQGINKDSKLLGWSMSKSVTSALVGQLVGEGRLQLDQKAPVEEWQGAFDKRQNITVRQMLNMASGLSYFELFSTWCLFASEGNPAGWYADRPLAREPGSTFRYSTGCTSLLSRTLHENRANPQLSNTEYIREKLFKRIQMHNSLIELQAIDGVPLGGSHTFCSARDWARFGLLYMRNGVWVNGDRILPEGWTDYSCEPSPAMAVYGAQWWINSNDTPYCYMSGFRNQNVVNVKSKDLTIIRLSMPGITESFFWDGTTFFQDVISCFP